MTGIPRNKYHNGGRLRFGPDGKLYAAAGDGQAPHLAQDLASLAGRLRTVEPTIDGNLWLTTSTGGDKDSIPQNSNEKIFEITLGDG